MILSIIYVIRYCNIYYKNQLFDKNFFIILYHYIDAKKQYNFYRYCDCSNRLLLNPNMFNFGNEGYSTISTGNRYGKIDPYYYWRTYSHEAYPYNILKSASYPYTYKPKPYPSRYFKYHPYFIKYGYGHL